MAKILIVDDDKKITTLLDRFLSTHGHQVVSLNQSSRTLEAANELIPDLFILDIMMPHPDGYTLCKLLRADPDFVRTPILIITALDNSNSKATTFGANDYLTKPFDLDELLARIDLLLNPQSPL
jgi:two-component system, OmpR family, response regulator MprA